MRIIDASIAFIRSGEYFWMQRRGPGSMFMAPGKIGNFGGKIEEDETAQQAASREVAEETNLVLPSDEYSKLGKLSVVVGPLGYQTRINAHVFEVAVDDDMQVSAREGEGKAIKMTKNQILESQELTALTRATVEEFLRKEI